MSLVLMFCERDGAAKENAKMGTFAVPSDLKFNAENASTR